MLDKCQLRDMSNVGSFVQMADRGLLDTTDAAVTVVTTAAGLQTAVKAGKPHIEIQAHLDLTTLDTVTCDNGACILGVGSNGYIPSTVKSIRVRTCRLSTVQRHSSAIRS